MLVVGVVLPVKDSPLSASAVVSADLHAICGWVPALGPCGLALGVALQCAVGRYAGEWHGYV